MNIQNFLQTGGFPLETDTLDKMQTAYSLFNALGNLAGEKVIISGCQVNGNTTGDGVVYYNGEIFDFVGGPTQTSVRIIEEQTSKVFENGVTKVTHTRRYIAFGAGPGSMLWSGFKSINPILDIQKAIVPVGMISLWSGSINNIPTGWALCDGSNGTPDLKGRFVVGYNPNDGDYNTIGKKGGLKEVTLSEQQMPVHNHTGTTNVSGNHNHTVPNDYKESPGDTDHTPNEWGAHANPNQQIPTSSAGAHSHTLTTNNKGGGQSHENRPPYYTLAYIMFKG